MTDALYSVVKWIFIINLFIYDAHIIHYHMNPLWLVALVQSYFTHLDYMIIHCWISATFIASFFTSQLHILILKHHFRVTSLSIDNMWVFFCYCFSVIPQLLGSRITHTDLVWITIGLPEVSLCGMSVFCPCLILHSGHYEVIHPCIILLWFYTESFSLLQSALHLSLLLCCIYGP